MQKTVIFNVCRILGNDLPPRHAENQTETNLEFLLTHEPDLAFAEKTFVLNRIYDVVQKNKLKRMIERFGYRAWEIPFDASEYNSSLDPAHKFAYLTNVNRARNFALEQAWKTADMDQRWVLPLDGGCIFRGLGWEDICSNAADMLAHRDRTPYFTIPMFRMGDNNRYGNDSDIQIEETFHIASNAVHSLSEPQIAIGKEADCKFNPALQYGRVDKVEMLWKLGITGVWDSWEPVVKKQALSKKSKHFGKVKSFGYVCRMDSGNPDADRNNVIRGRTRAQAIPELLNRVKELTGV